MFLSKLGSFVAETRYDDLPDEVVEQAKLHLLDTIGCGLLGWQINVYRPFLELIKDLDMKKESSVFGEQWKGTCLNASLINAVMINSTDYEGTHRASVSHPAAIIIPAALAMGERERADGKAVIEALAVGYECFGRVATSLNPSHMRRGFHTTATAAPLGTAAVASKILKFKEGRATNALSLAATQGAGFLESCGVLECKNFQVARSGQSGILSALLTEKEVRAPSTMLEGGSFYPTGLLQAFSDSYKTERLTMGLGKGFEISQTAIKLHGGCRYVHSSIDGAIEVCREYSLRPDDIESITVKLTSQASRLMLSEPKTGDEARFHIPFAVSIAILEGDVGFHKFSTEKLQDPKINAFSKKVKGVSDARLDQEAERTGNLFASVIEAKTKDGKTYTTKTEYPKGEPENPLSKEQILNKFRRLASGVIGPDRSERIISLIEELEKVDDISKIMSLAQR